MTPFWNRDIFYIYQFRCCSIRQI